MQAYEDNILATKTTSAECAWTGDASDCTAGDVSALARAHSLTRINYFRARVGLGPVDFSDELNNKAQQAALMMDAERNLSHDPSSDFACFTEEGKEAASKSNIAYGVVGADAVSTYMRDRGDHNIAVGHRRWIFYSRGKTIGHGFTNRGDAMWVIGNHGPSTVSQEFMAWPTPGINPAPLVPERWSITVPRADFSQAQVAVTDASGTTLAVSVHEVFNGYGDNTLVWEMLREDVRPLAADATLHVAVTNVALDGETQAYRYAVTISDPTRAQDCGDNFSWNSADCACQPSTSSAPEVWAALTELTGPIDVALFDMVGRQVKQVNSSGFEADNPEPLTSGLPVGVYVAVYTEQRTGRRASTRVFAH